jgi:hypothetical protein
MVQTAVAGCTSGVCEVRASPSACVLVVDIIICFYKVGSGQGHVACRLGEGQSDCAKTQTTAGNTVAELAGLRPSSIISGGFRWSYTTKSR